MAGSAGYRWYSMPTERERFTETLSQVRVREIRGRQPGVVRLRVNGGSGQHELRVAERRVTGGAHHDNTVVLPNDPAVSNVHFELLIDERGATLRDLGSKNGTWIHPGVRVREVWIEPGASFGVGSSRIEMLGVEDVDIPVSTIGRFATLHGFGSAMGELFAKLDRLAPLPLDVLVTGETGTGKELVARGLHAESERSNGPLVVLDCTSLNDSIAESILFGHAKGSFTGAVDDRAGLLEEADKGTLFIDEVGELPLAQQAKLLRALGEREVCRVGETRRRRFDARIIAATNRDLVKMVSQGAFREDLYFRLARVTLNVPALRERGAADIHGLADLFLDRFARERGTRLRWSKPAYDRLASHPWPGNVRELHNVVRYAALWAQNDEVGVDDLPPLAFDRALQSRSASSAASSHVAELEAALLSPFSEARQVFERVYVTRVLAETNGNKSEAARRLDMSPSSFWDLVKRVQAD